MFYTLVTVSIWLQSIYVTRGLTCPNKCPTVEADMVCGFDVKGIRYTMFPSKCALDAYKECYQVEMAETPLKFCIKDHNTSSRKMYGESCPVFCANYYRPVCGASKFRDYVYRTFNNGCYLDMVNCRGDDDMGYVEVPLEYCQRHLMKNIFKEHVVATNLQEFHDYY